MPQETLTARPRRASDDDTQALWLHYKRTGDIQLRNRLVMAHLPMVQYIVAKKVRELPSRSNVEDFVSCGIIALIGAIDRYDDARGATLKQFAWTRVQGAVVDELRRLDWAPRSLRRWERDVSQARDRFFAQHGRRPSREELAEMVGTTPEELRRKDDEVHLAEVVSLNSVIKASEDTPVERQDTIADDSRFADPEGVAMSRHGKELFRQAFAGLADREREVAVMLYLKSMTLREIGDQLGISESRVCQLHAQIKAKLSSKLSHDRDLLTATA